MQVCKDALKDTKCIYLFPKMRWLIWFKSIYFHSRDAKEACIYSLARCQKPNTLWFDTNLYCWVVKSLAQKSAENKTITKFILIFPFFSYLFSELFIEWFSCDYETIQIRWSIENKQKVIYFLPVMFCFLNINLQPTSN